MKNDNLLNAFDHIDERFVSEAMEYYEDEDVVKDRLAKRYKRLFLLASAACILLTLILLPSKTIRIDEYIYVPPFFGAPNLGSEISTIPEHDGSRGLRYTVNADGKSASFIGFGSCTESTVVIASYYGDLPVTEVYLASSSATHKVSCSAFFSSRRSNFLTFSKTRTSFTFRMSRISSVCTASNDITLFILYLHF